MDKHKHLAVFRPDSGPKTYGDDDYGRVIVKGIVSMPSGLSYTNRYGKTPGIPCQLVRQYDSLDEAEDAKDDAFFNSNIVVNRGGLRENIYPKDDNKPQELTFGRPTLKVDSYDDTLLTPADKTTFASEYGSGPIVESADSYSV